MVPLLNKKELIIITIIIEIVYYSVDVELTTANYYYSI